MVGEYCHLLALYCLCTATGDCHVAALLVFIVLGGMLASLNHTRLDVRLPWGIYEVRSHDVHHRLPKSNYGQYTQLWDVLLGTFRRYDENYPGGSSDKLALD